MRKNFSDLITLHRKDSKLDPLRAINKTNYKKILNNIPILITLWKLKGEDFLLVYSNKAAEEIIEPKLSLGIRLSKALPGEYKNIFVHISSNSENNSFTQIMIDENLLLIFQNGLKGNLIDQNPNQNQENYKNGLFKTIIEQSPVSIYITDIQGNIEYINPKLVEITGYSPNEIIGKNPKIWKACNKSSEEYKKLWDTILSGNVWNGEFMNKRKNGGHYYESAVISPIKDSNGVINNFVVIKEDITKLKEADTELRKSDKFAAIGKIAAYVSHEIKTPLTSIKINVDILEKDRSINADSKRLIYFIQIEVKHITNLLKNILQFSSQSSLSFLDINLHKKIENIKEFLEPLLKEKGVTLFNRTSDHNIFGDAQQLQSLFIHLIENSLESMNTGGEIEISSELKGDQCYIYVKDNGCGVNCGANIFEPFITTKSTGTGLGLPIVKNIIDKHHGSIKLVTSKQGETLFEIILPSRGG